MLKRLRREQAGQSTAEYALLSFALVAGGASLLNFAPDSLKALDVYLMGIYYMVGLPLG